MMGLHLDAGLQSSDEELDAHRTTSRHPMNFEGWGRWLWNSSDDLMDDGPAPDAGPQSSDEVCFLIGRLHVLNYLADHFSLKTSR